MDQDQEIFCFLMDNQRYGIPLFSVERFLQAVTVNPVPNSPPLIHGLIDYYGSLVPVINFRHRLKLPEKPISASDYFLIVKTAERKLALVIDDVEDVIIPASKNIVQASSLAPGMDNIGFLRHENGIVFIYNLETFITGSEEETLREIIDNASK